MSNIQNRKSVLFLVPEVTEGTPVAPSSAGQAVALQSGFSVEPNTDSQESDEIRGSLGKTKAILGAEHPTASFNHYLRGSGVEGQAPGFASLIKAFFGAMTTNATERLTTTSSTVSLIKLASGGTDYARGFAVMVKGAINRIRPVLSVSTNDLALGFALPSGAAPGTGVGMGKCINFSPDDDANRSLTAWLYRGAGGLIEMIAGARVASLSTDFQAGKLINMSFALQGSEYFFNPIEIVTADAKLDFDDGDPQVGTIPIGMYKDPHDLASAIQAAMNAATDDNITVTYHNDGTKKGKFTIASDGSELALLFATGSNLANSIANKIGFAATDLSASLTYDSDTVISYASPYTPSYDSNDPLVAKDMELLLGDSTDDTGVTRVQSVKINPSVSLSDIEDITSASGINGKTNNGREITIEMSATIAQHDADKYRRYRQGSNIAFCLNFGVKSGGSWVPGKCGCFYAPNSTVSKMVIEDVNGTATIKATLKCYVASDGLPEIYLNFL